MTILKNIEDAEYFSLEKPTQSLKSNHAMSESDDDSSEMNDDNDQPDENALEIFKPKRRSLSNEKKWKPAPSENYPKKSIHIKSKNGYLFKSRDMSAC